jgi:hypothetical protein
MPIEYTRDDSRRRINVRLIRPVTTDEFLDLIDRQAREGAWQYGMLYDARGSVEAPPPVDSARMLARIRDLANRLGERGPIAIVTASTAAIGIAQVYAFRAEKTMNVQIFWDKAEAERWLDERTT